MSIQNISQTLTLEMIVAVLTLALLAIGLLLPTNARKGMLPLTVFSILGVMVYTAYEFFSGETATFMEGAYYHDQFATFFKFIFLTTGLLVVLSSTNYVQKFPAYRSEFYPLMLGATLGMMLMAGAGDLITLYVGLELTTICFYVLVAYHMNDGKASEAGIKYLVLNATSSALFLYGISLLYGLAGSTKIAEISQALAGQLSPAVILALVFILVGFAFKISLVPFHMWAPDIYEGAPTPIAAYLAVASKAAAFAALIRIYLLHLGEQSLAPAGETILLVLAAATMIMGNLMAIPQTNIKRLFAYSSISQAGYVMVGILAASAAGVKGVLFYSMIYVFASVGAFAVATHVGQAQGSDEISAYAGLAKRSPLAAAALTVSLLSLAGIPPLAGFVGKFYLFSAAMSEGFVVTVFIGFVMSMVSMYYYLNIVKVMYLSDGEGLPDVPVRGATKFTMVLTFVITLALGIYPSPLAQMAFDAANSLIK